MLALLNYAIVFGIGIVIIIFCIVKINRSLRTDIQSVNKSTRTLQWKILILLFLQLLIPLVSAIVPANIILILSALGVKSERAVDIISCSFALSPITEPILILIFIKKYRLTLMFWRSQGKKKTSSGWVSSNM